MAMRKIHLGTFLVIAVTVFILGALAATSLVAYQRISNAGNVKAVGVGVYWDSSCTSKVTSIDWGSLEPGAQVVKTVYIRNEGTVPVVLNMTTDNWNPASARDYITLTWNREDYVLSSGSAVSADLTLSVSSGVSGVTSFSFDIIISGTEQT